MSLLLLLLGIPSAHADTWSLALGPLVQDSPEAAWVRADASGRVHVMTVVRGKLKPGQVQPHAWLPPQTTGLLLCGHPSANGGCAAALEKDGLVWLHQTGGDLHSMGHVPPGVTTPDRLRAMLAGKPVDPLCVRVGSFEVRVDAMTGRGDLPSGPVGVSAGGGLVHLAEYSAGPDPVYVGNSGHTNHMGREGRLEADGCVVFDETAVRPWPPQ